MASSIEEVLDIVKGTGTLPVIFAGSGVSKRYTTNKYDWEGLLINCIAQYNSDPENKYKEYKVDVEYSLHTSEVNKFSINEGIGEKVERDFNKAYYRGDIDKCILKDTETDNPLKSFVANKLSVYEIDNSMAEEIDLLQKLNEKMLTVVTTNYDTFFEDHIFKKHEKVIGQNIFKKSEVATLFKIHGCASDPSSLILTRRDYEIFAKKRRVLSAKLISLFTENPVIFLGYSLSDENVKSILLDIFQCIDEDHQLKKFEERLIFVDYKEDQQDPVIGTHSIMIEDIEISLTKITLSSYLPLLRELQSLERTVRFKDLRHIKDLVYDIVQTDEGERKKLVNLVDDNTEDINDEEIIVAILKNNDLLDAIGVTGIQADQIFDDLITNSLSKRINGQEEVLIQSQIPALLISNSVIPVNKYLSKLDYVGLELDPKVVNMMNKTSEDLLNNSIIKDHKLYQAYEFKSLEGIWLDDQLAKYRRLNFLVLRSVYDVEPEEIKEFLMNYGVDIKKESGGVTAYRKMVCIYDILTYKNAE